MSFFLLFLAISSASAFLARFLDLRSARARSAASRRESLIRLLVGSSESLLETSEKSLSSSLSSELDSEESSTEGPCCFCNH